MPFLWLNIDDPPGPKSDRRIIEAGAIALLSNFERTPIDAPSTTWLGLHAASPAIRKSGLWNVNHVADDANGAFLSVLEERLSSPV
jgi:hypothetical protein